MNDEHPLLYYRAEAHIRFYYIIGHKHIPAFQAVHN